MLASSDYINHKDRYVTCNKLDSKLSTFDTVMAIFI